MRLDLKTVSTALGIVVVIVAAALWLPSNAQDKVDAQAERQEKTDTAQTVEIAALRTQVAVLTTAQAVTNTNLEHLTKAVQESTAKDDELKLEIKQLISAIQ